MAYNQLEQAEFADNPEPRCPVVLLLDTSTSMHGPPIDEVNNGLKQLASELSGDRLASLRVEIAVIAFGGSVRAMDVRGGGGTVPFDAAQAFVAVDQFQPPTLKANGDTPMGEAMRRGLTLLRERKDIYKEQSVDYFRPWLFLLTDGQPNDSGWESAADQAKQEEDRKGVSIFAIGVSGADMSTLARFSNRQPLPLRDTAWMSKSLTSVAQSKPGDMIPLAPVGWATIQS